MLNSKLKCNSQNWCWECWSANCLLDIYILYTLNFFFQRLIIKHWKQKISFIVYWNIVACDLSCWAVSYSWQDANKFLKKLCLLGIISVTYFLEHFQFVILTSGWTFFIQLEKLYYYYNLYIFFNYLCDCVKICKYYLNFILLIFLLFAEYFCLFRPQRLFPF